MGTQDRETMFLLNFTIVYFRLSVTLSHQTQWGLTLRRVVRFQVWKLIWKGLFNRYVLSKFQRAKWKKKISIWESVRATPHMPIWGSTARYTRLGKSGRIAKLLRKMCSTTWCGFFSPQAKKIFNFFFASHTLWGPKNTQHVTKNLILCQWVPKRFWDFLRPFPIFLSQGKNSLPKKSVKKTSNFDSCSSKAPLRSNI